MKRPPDLDGVRASRVQLPRGPWVRVLDALCVLFPAIPRTQWQVRFDAGRILDEACQPLPADAGCSVGMQVYYYRDVSEEPRLAAEATILHRDDHLLVVDKPHFLAVTPAGRFVRDTLLARLTRETGLDTLAPLHRIDRATAGLVMFSVKPATRDAYQALFRQRAIDKRYEAIALALPDVAFPVVRRSRIERGEPFFRMREAAGEANSETRIEVIARGQTHWHYALHPLSGRKHQLRVHMASLGAAILHDPLYPQLDQAAIAHDHAPLQLLAKGLSFADPLDGRPRRFESRLALLEVALCGGADRHDATRS